MQNSYIYHTDKLKGNYREAFRYVEVYISTIRRNSTEMEERMSCLLDNLLEAQQNGRPVYSVMGSDYDKFCHSFTADTSPAMTVKAVIFGLLDATTPFIFFFLLDLFSYLMAENRVDLWNYQGSFPLWGYLAAIAVIYLMLEVTTRFTAHQLKSQKIAVKKLQTIQTICVFLSILIVAVVTPALGGTAVPLWLELAVPSIGIIHKMIHRYKNREAIRERKANKISFAEAFEIDTSDVTYDTLDKMMARKMKRAAKRGKVFDKEAFLQKQEKDVQNTRKLHWYVIVITAAVVLSCCIFDYLSSRDLVGTLIFGVILAVIEYFFMRYLWKIALSGADDKQRWIDRQRAEEEQNHG